MLLELTCIENYNDVHICRLRNVILILNLNSVLIVKPKFW